MSLKFIKTFTKTVQQSFVLSQISKVPTRSVAVMGSNVENSNDCSNQPEEKEEVLRNKNSTRYKRRWYERKWETNEKIDGSEEKKARSEDRIKRKKMAMLLGYCGANYFGMQRNPGVKTIEEDLLKALREAKYITEEDYQNQQNAQFQRSSRTDKGVSAARQVVSLKLPLEVNIDEINSRLPDCIRVFGVRRVTNRFNSKVNCNARSYSYTLPTYVLDASLKLPEERRRYRAPPEKIDTLKEALAVYTGTKNYHNFTQKKHFHDPSASRYMMSFTVDRIFVHSDMEFAVLLVKGQSFMLHQIRKMVGLAVMVTRGEAPPDVMTRAFQRDKLMLPTAPGLGLVLDMVHYDIYAAKHKGSHDSLTWEETEDAVQKFKEEHIYPYIVQGEINDDSMGQWLEKIEGHSYDPVDDSVEKETVDEKKETEENDSDSDVDDSAEKCNSENVNSSESAKVEVN